MPLYTGFKGIALYGKIAAALQKGKAAMMILFLIGIIKNK